MNHNPHQKFLRVSQSAKNLNCSPTSIYNYVRAGKLRAYRFAGTGTIRIAERDLAEFIRQSQIGGEEVRHAE